MWHYYKPVQLKLKMIIMSTEISKTRKAVAWILAGLLTLLFLNSASGKLFFHPELMQQIHLENWRVIIAIGEIVSALLFLFPQTNKFGTLLLSSFMGGAIIVHMTGGQSILFPAVVLVIVWFVYYLRTPDFFKLS
jgi:hypothetical protein